VGRRGWRRMNGEVLTIVVRDVPRPQGSKKGFPVKRKDGSTGVNIVNDNPKALQTWREAVKEAAVRAMEVSRWEELTFPIAATPVGVQVTFTLAKPKSAPKRLRTWPHKKPDLEKLTRSVCDALTAAGVYADDGQIVEEHVYKDFPLANDRDDPDSDRLEIPGAVIRVWVVKEPENA
jgi:Holliday junction resolvase RusA-like endonuclease